MESTVSHNNLIPTLGLESCLSSCSGASHHTDWKPRAASAAEVIPSGTWDVGNNQHGADQSCRTVSSGLISGPDCQELPSPPDLCIDLQWCYTVNSTGLSQTSQPTATSAAVWKVNSELQWFCSKLSGNICLYGNISLYGLWCSLFSILRSQRHQLIQ